MLASNQMAKKVTKKGSVEPKEEVEKVVEEVEEDVVNVTSSQSEESDEDNFEGFSSADEGDSSNVHTVKKLDPKRRKQKQTKEEKVSELSGIVYVSRLPHGFHERELSKYFSQFGDLKEVKLARNKRSGNSRHYGFIEFANKDDAKIAQETMNNYLLMGHLLQVRVLPKGSKIDKLYKYKKRAFQQAPVKKTVDELKDKAKAKHEERMQQLQKAGIEFSW